MVHHLLNDLYWWFRCRSSLFVISLFLFVCCHPSDAAFSGGLVNIYTRLTIADSPFHIRDDVYVEKNAELRIDPGVILYFSPRKGITVKGRLTAKVSLMWNFYGPLIKGSRGWPVLQRFKSS